MGGLIYRNFYTNTSSFRLSVIVSAICCASLVFYSFTIRSDAENQSSLLYIIAFLLYYFCFMLSGLTSTMVFQTDENKTASAFAISLPQGGKGHIQSKYWYLLIILLTTLFITFISDTISFFILGGKFSALLVLLLLFSGRLLMFAIEIPFMVRFGVMKGIKIKGIIVSFILLLVITYFLFGDISWLLYSDDPVKALINWLKNGDIVLVLSLLPPFSIFAYWLSCKISVKLFRKGAENYEQ